MKTANTIAPSLQFSAFLNYLKARGLPIFPQTFEMVELVVNDMLTNYDPGNTRSREQLIHDLKGLLAPIIVHGAEEQELFYQLYDEYFHNTVLTKATTPPPKKIFPINEIAEEIHLPEEEEEKQEPIWRTLLLWTIGVATIGGLAYLATMIFPSLAESNTYLYIIGGFLLLSLIGIGFQIYGQRNPSKPSKVELPEKLSAPYRYFPSINTPPVSLIQTNDTLELVDTLSKRRESDLNTHNIHIPKTIQATVERAGHISVRYHQDIAPPQYIVLLDDASLNQHHLEWFTYINDIVEASGIRADLYTFHGNPSNCKDAFGAIYQLDELFDDQRMIIIGTGEAMVDHIHGELYPWAFRLLDQWDMRGLLTIKATHEWSSYESILSRSIEIAPATLDGFLSIVEEFDGIGENDPEDWYGNDEDELFEEPDVEFFSLYLDEPLFEWICACAIYPEIYWGLTVDIANVLEERAHDLLNREYISILTRIKWFKDGEIPENQRIELLNFLPDHVNRKIRERIAGILNDSQNTFPPLESVAGYNIRLYKLINELYLTNDEKSRKDTINQIDRLYRKGFIENDETLDRHVKLALTKPDNIRLAEGDAQETEIVLRPITLGENQEETLEFLANIFELKPEDLAQINTNSNPILRLNNAFTRDRDLENIYRKRTEDNPEIPQIIYEDDMWSTRFFGTDTFLTSLSENEMVAVRKLQLHTFEQLSSNRLQRGIYYLMNPEAYAETLKDINRRISLVSGLPFYDIFLGINSYRLNQLLKNTDQFDINDFISKTMNVPILSDGKYQVELYQLFDYFEDLYNSFIVYLLDHFPDIQIVLHGYGYNYLWEQGSNTNFSGLRNIYTGALNIFQKRTWRRNFKAQEHKDRDFQQALFRDWTDRYNELLERLAATHERVEYVDLRSIFESAKDYNWYHNPDKRLHQKIAAALYRPIQQFFFPVEEAYDSFQSEEPLYQQQMTESAEEEFYPEEDREQILRRIRIALENEKEDLQIAIDNFHLIIEDSQLSKRQKDRFFDISSRFFNEMERAEYPSVRRELMGILEEMERGAFQRSTLSTEQSKSKPSDEPTFDYSQLLSEFSSNDRLKVRSILEDKLFIRSKSGSIRANINSEEIKRIYGDLEKVIERLRDVEAIRLLPSRKQSYGQNYRIGKEEWAYSIEEYLEIKSQQVDDFSISSRKSTIRQIPSFILEDIRKYLIGYEIEKALEELTTLAEFLKDEELGNTLASVTNRYLDIQDRKGDEFKGFGVKSPYQEEEFAIRDEILGIVEELESGLS